MTWPLGPWPEDEIKKHLGRLLRQNILMVLESLSMTLLMKEHGRTKEDVGDMVQEVRKELDDLGKHVLFSSVSPLRLVLKEISPRY